MSAHREVRLFCDYGYPPAEGEQYGRMCSTEFHADPKLGFISSIVAMRQEAAKAGWTYIRSPATDRRTNLDKDYCPDHKPADASA